MGKKTVSWTHRFPSFLTRALGLLSFTLLISKLFGLIWKTNKTLTATTTNLSKAHHVTKDLYHERCLSNYAINRKANPWSIPHGLWALRLELRSGFQAISLKENYTSLDGSALKGLGKVGEQTDTPCSSQHHLILHWVSEASACWKFWEWPRAREEILLLDWGNRVMPVRGAITHHVGWVKWGYKVRAMEREVKPAKLR